MAPRAQAIAGAPPKRRAEYLTPSLTLEEVKVIIASLHAAKIGNEHRASALSELRRWVASDGAE